MKMIVRVDDVGFSDVCNIGTFETLDKGIATSADVMLDVPGTVDALNRLKKYPWISVGWHTHMWGSPLSDINKVPSLVEHEGEFKGRFRTDLRSSNDINYDELVLELEAQLERCKKILGRYPDTGATPHGDNVFDKALRYVMDKHNIPYGFASRQVADPRPLEVIKKGRENNEEWAFLYGLNGMPSSDALPKYKDKKILILDGGLAYIDLLTDRLSDVENNYDPVKYYLEDRAGILKMDKDIIVEQSWHPGWLDYFVYRLGERSARPRARQFGVARCIDVKALCDERLKKWIKDNHIELINFKDALYGTNTYQEHLKAINSDLYMLGK